jgi:hypothetical protein
MKIAHWFFFFFLTLPRLWSQNLELYSNGGGVITSGTIQGSYSLGEMLVSTESVTGYKITQGFQQALLFVVGTKISFAKGNWKIYPIPFQHEVFYAGEKAISKAQVTVYSAAGRPVFTEKRDLEISGSWNLSGLTAGWYLLRAEDDKGEIIFQQVIIKQ